MDDRWTAALSTTSSEPFKPVNSGSGMLLITIRNDGNQKELISVHKAAMT